ncbi:MULTISPECIES: Xaa-Pro peptidase family protein [Microbacterium]|uniref:M24 family metallopeptidase n=1 Tax=Microbacterium TaxID=33882 RepID=UPI0013A5B14B|nr:MULTISPECIES: Xaa-Pro peptidase family protein [Microbacterium]
MTATYASTNPTGRERHLATAVDLDALNAERLERAKAGLRTAGIAAALLFDPANVRYATCDGQSIVFNLHDPFRWALVFAEDEPILWESYDEMRITRSRWTGDMREAHGFGYFGSGPDSTEDARIAMDEVYAELSSRGLLGEPLGIDRANAVVFLELQRRGIKLVNASPALEVARAVKTPLELDIHRDNARLVDIAVNAFLPALVPGRTENEMWAELAHQTFAHGALYAEARLLSSGPRTNPWMQEASDRVVLDGEIVGFDTDLVGPYGYLTDISRSYLVGEKAPTTEQRDVYQAAYYYVHESIPEFTAGRSFQELGELLGARMPKEYQSQRYPFIAHGCGAVDEYPVVVLGDNHAGVLEPGMVLSVEGYMGRVGGPFGVKYEDQIIITDGAPELISFAPADERLL